MRVLSSLRSGASISIAVLRRPTLWATATKQILHLVPRRWWARAPFLPVPNREYMRFRVLTQYGDQDHVLEVADVLKYLYWLKDSR